jgi:hypothetical protein
MAISVYNLWTQRTRSEEDPGNDLSNSAAHSEGEDKQSGESSAHAKRGKSVSRENSPSRELEESGGDTFWLMNDILWNATSI